MPQAGKPNRQAPAVAAAYRHLVDGALLATARGASATGLVFIPPLIGDTALAQLHRFRRLRRDGLSLYTFAYPGHPGTSGRFSLRAAMGATGRHLARAARLADRQRIPLFGLGCCAAAIPLLAAVHDKAIPPASLLLLNPIVEIDPATSLQAYWSYSRTHARHPLERLGALPAFLDHLFPGIVKNRARFGSLHRGRVAATRLLADLFNGRLLAAVRLEQTPVVCCYGRADALLKALMPRGPQTYEAAIRRHCRRVVFKPLPGSHFLAGRQLRYRLQRIIRSAFRSY